MARSSSSDLPGPRHAASFPALGRALAVLAFVGSGACTPPRADPVPTGPSAPVPAATALTSSGPTAEDAALPKPATEPADAAPARAPGTRTKTYRVAAMGDSLTDARAKGGAFLDVLRERCPRSTFDNYGVGGQRVDQMRARFAREILRSAADGGAAPYTDVLVWGGVNDLYSDVTNGRTPAGIEGDLDAMYTSARAKGLRVIALTVAPWSGFTAYWNPGRQAATLEVNRWIRDAASRGKIDGVVDAWALLSCGDSERLCPSFARRDGLHVTTSGQRRLGEELHGKFFSDCE